MPTDRGIMFSAPMVLALLAGRKRQTRRLATSPLRRAQIGDRLWVRESYRVDREWDSFAAGDLIHEPRVWPEADRDNCDAHGKLRPSIFMPRWASRLTLIVTNVRTEPLQAISATDAMAEGVERDGALWRDYLGGSAIMDPRASFRSLWESLHDKPGERWADNPDLVALTFNVRVGNIDQIDGGGQ